MTKKKDNFLNKLGRLLLPKAKANRNLMLLTILLVVVGVGFVVYQSLAATKKFTINKDFKAPSPPKYSYTSPTVTSTGSGSRKVCLFFGNNGEDTFNLSAWSGGKKFKSQTFDVPDSNFDHEGLKCMSYTGKSKGTKMYFRILVGVGSIHANELQVTY